MEINDILNQLRIDGPLLELLTIRKARVGEPEFAAGDLIVHLDVDGVSRNLLHGSIKPHACRQLQRDIWTRLCAAAKPLELSMNQTPRSLGIRAYARSAHLPLCVVAYDGGVRGEDDRYDGFIPHGVAIGATEMPVGELMCASYDDRLSEIKMSWRLIFPPPEDLKLVWWRTR